MSPNTRREGTHKYGVDLIVMDTYGRTDLAHLFIGSADEYVLRHAPVRYSSCRLSKEVKRAGLIPSTSDSNPLSLSRNFPKATMPHPAHNSAPFTRPMHRRILRLRFFTAVERWYRRVDPVSRVSGEEARLGRELDAHCSASAREFERDRLSGSRTSGPARPPVG